MKRRGFAVVALLIVILVLVTTIAYAQDDTASQEAQFDFGQMVEDFQDWKFWIALVATLIAGALGGLVYELLILQGNLELPHRAAADEAGEEYPHAVFRNLYDLGIWARVIIGGLAAVAAMLFLRPADGFSLLATALVAGSAGTAVFRSLQDRITAALAQKDTADALKRSDLMLSKVSDAQAAAGRAMETMKHAPSEGDADRAGKAAPIVSDLSEVQSLLSEAKGIGEGF